MVEGREPPETVATHEPKRTAAAVAVAVGLAQSMETKREVAAVAAATALQLETLSPMRPLAAPGNLLSPWQFIMRSNQLAKKSRGSLR